MFDFFVSFAQTYMTRKFLHTTITSLLLCAFLFSGLPVSASSERKLPESTEPYLQNISSPSSIRNVVLSDGYSLLVSDTQLFLQAPFTNAWNEVSPSDLGDNPLLAAHFFDAQRGWAFWLDGESGEATLSASTNGGLSWRKLPNNLGLFLNSDTNSPVQKAWMQWISPRHGILALKTASGVNFSEGLFLQSTDGGQNWQALSSPVKEEFIFFDKMLGFMLNPFADDSLYRTEDGGASWSLMHLSIAIEDPEQYAKLHLPLILGDGSILLLYQLQNELFLVPYTPDALENPAPFLKISFDIAPFVVQRLSNYDGQHFRALLAGG